jgi:hypothetical protein
MLQDNRTKKNFLGKILKLQGKEAKSAQPGAGSMAQEIRASAS